MTVMSMVDDGILALDTPARSLLQNDLPLIDDQVTVQHLLAHRSGIGDYIDEALLGDNNDYIMSLPVHLLDTTEAYLPMLDGHPQREPPGETFRYNNSGYVVLALLAERAARMPFDTLVDQRVCRKAGLSSTAFLRGDELPGDAAVGYLAVDGLRTNVLHLPVRGSGDGGIFSTAEDVHLLWRAFLGGDVVTPERRDLMLYPLSEGPAQDGRYGMGCWHHRTTDLVWFEGMDAGVSFRSVHDRGTGITHTVVSNTSSGAWPITSAIDEALGLS
jgi:CubicO group peptidase (beta-lactamase class C family)